MNEILISRTYLRFIKSKPCVVMHHSCDGPIDPHHLIARGQRESKRNDFTCIPLCRTHHTEVEYGGAEKFESDYRINLWQENSRLLINWVVYGQGDLLEQQLQKSLKVIRDAKKGKNDRQETD
jgi:hypothetical protein